MKKLSNNKGTIHPSPPLSSDHFYILPAAIITLAATLSPQDKEVLAYLISCSSTPANNFSKSTTKVSGSGRNHPTEFSCDCFRCYMSYWVRWDASPNRELIHEIIEAYEDGLYNKKVVKISKKDRRKRIADVPAPTDDHDVPGESEPVKMELNFHDEVEKRIQDGELGCESGAPSTVRKLVNFVGDRIWGVWGII